MKKFEINTNRLNIELMDEDGSQQLYEKNYWGLWKVSVKGNDVFIGYILVKPLNISSEFPDVNNIEIGWRFKQENWGQGYATEAAKAVADKITEQKNIKIISATADASNIASIRIMEKLGMSFIKNYNDKTKGADVTSVLYSKVL
ncbi:GNAT family N-acetyltransferase [Colwellia sp. 1_MG-2023]|uniref:GNAT family N-acetyltransferase n=1 Tax=unclassified Colwellia TaxID=196834 RepID=UPI001C083947|nr:MULTISPECIES: GNAT family N-acetyltransferase [unclassified Colwellia]MBU2926574.1 GNAT family N-acetyltransferase [Colwellia sp. C2M11]MDO6652612.1 GNAT family N-acetyltransferase [Colwellia sp. 3_MG-2023]MDO6665213.1 GNAT family N-acetyltransferase [Colwellia sp. 2_MG-2023]MDO6689465.1 GNAT family N-acetyltransferase [Colwellia sp. 1_MG-2023]